MKKRIVMLLCAAVLTLSLTAVPAMASDEPFSPIEVEAYTYGPFDEPRVNKVYRLPATDNPSAIPTEDFERGGRVYHLLGIAADDTNCEVITYTAVFGSREIAKTERRAGASGAAEFQPLDADIAEKGAGPDLLPFWVCAGCMAMAAAIALCSIKSKHEEGGSK